MPRDYRHPTTITTLRPIFPSSPLSSGRYPLGGPLMTLFGRSSLGGGRSSSIRSSSLSSPFVFGLGDVPRRTRLPLKILAYSRLPDLPRLEPSPIVYGRQLRLRPTSAPFDGLAVYLISIIISLIRLISVTMITGDHRLPSISIAYTSFPWSVHAYASLSLTVPNMYKHGLCV